MSTWPGVSSVDGVLGVDLDVVVGDPGLEELLALGELVVLGGVVVPWSSSEISPIWVSTSLV